MVIMPLAIICGIKAFADPVYTTGATLTAAEVAVDTALSLLFDAALPIVFDPESFAAGLADVVGLPEPLSPATDVATLSAAAVALAWHVEQTVVVA